MDIIMIMMKGGLIHAKHPGPAAAPGDQLQTPGPQGSGAECIFICLLPHTQKFL